MTNERFNRLRIFRNPRAIAAFTALLVPLVALGAAIWWLLFYSAQDDGDWQDERGRPAVDQADVIPTPPEPVYKSLTPEEAFEENAEMPFSDAPVEAALPLVMPANALSATGQRSATECLTAAIYYEGATEPLAGRRGIAQVILNRARHPAFPNSVCGVVYQGSQRRTGCQFTFTCDGSLARRPSRGGWASARMLATDALNGAIEPSVGMATHYHADYVVPYWADSLDKIVKVGAHIFYRWKGGWGRRTAFRQKVVIDDIAQGDLALIEPKVDELLGDDPAGAFPPSGDLPGMLPRRTPRIDQMTGTLITPRSDGAGRNTNDVSRSASGGTENTRPSLKADRNRSGLAIDENTGSLKE